MSDIVDDKTPLQEGRKDPLKGVDAPLRDQIVKKLYGILEEDGIGEIVVSVWNKGNANRSTWLERQQAYLASWDEHLINNTEGPFKGSSNLHIPMPFIVCKTMHARFLAALLGTDPPFNIRARSEASSGRVQTVSDTLRFALNDWMNYGKGIEAAADMFVWHWLTTGVGLMKTRWDVKYTRFIDVEQTVGLGAPRIMRDKDGKEVAVPQPKIVEKEVNKTKKVFEGPVVDVINPEDLLIIGGAGDPDLADSVTHRQFLTASELWTLVDRKVFNKDAVEKVIESGQNLKVNDQSSIIKQQRAQNAGNTNADSEQDLDRYEILECYLQYDVDGSGINSDIVVWVHKQTRELLRATFLHRIIKSGERPFTKADFHLRADQEMGTGMVELLYPLSREMDAIHNMRLDFGLISTMPFGFYRPSSGIEPEVLQLEPGSLIPCDNPGTDVYFPNLGNRTVFGMQEEQAIQGLIERLSSISDLNMGMIGGQGATRTATGARALVGESSSNLDVHLRRLNRGWRKLLRSLLHMLQQRTPAGLSFRLTGDSGDDYWTYIKTQDALQGDFDIELDANSASSNASMQQDKAQQIMQLTSNPMDIQLGLVDANHRYEALKNYLQSLGVRDFGRYIKQPDPTFQYMRLTPEEEANRVLHGIDVPVMPGMDHQAFIDFFQHVHDNDDLLGQFTKEQTIALARQAKRHEQALAAMQAQQAQQANAAQLHINAGMAAQQAPVGANPMAGSAPAPQAAPMGAPAGA